MTQLLTPEDVAKRLKVSPRTVQRGLEQAMVELGERVRGEVAETVIAARIRFAREYPDAPRGEPGAA